MSTHSEKSCGDVFGRSLVIPAKPSSTVHESAILRHNSLYTMAGILIAPSTYCAGETIAGAFNFHVFAPSIIALESPAREIPEFPEGARCFWLGYFHDHFGHFLTSTLQRLWRLRHHRHRPDWYIAPNYRPMDDENSFINVFLDNMGIDRTRIIAPPENTLLHQVEIPEPAFVENAHCHALWAPFMRDLGRRILGRSRLPPKGNPVFLSRSHAGATTRRYEGEDILCALLSPIGVEICQPETLSVKDQLALWESHTVFIGFSGSAFMNAAFFENKTVIILNHDTYIFGTQRMIDAVCHHHALYLDVSAFLRADDVEPNHYRITDPAGLAHHVVMAWRREAQACRPDVQGICALPTLPDQRRPIATSGLA